MFRRQFTRSRTNAERVSMIPLATDAAVLPHEVLTAVFEGKTLRLLQGTARKIMEVFVDDGCNMPD